VRRLARNCGECGDRRSRTPNDEGKGREDSRKIGLIGAIPMKPSGPGRLRRMMALRVAAGGATVYWRPCRSRRDEYLSAARAQRLTQERANDGNQGKASRGGIATFSLGELNSIQSWRTELGWWFSLPGDSAATP